MPIKDSISMCSSTLWMSKMDGGSSLRWMSASTMTSWHHFISSYSQVNRSQKSEPSWVDRDNYVRLLLYPYGQHINVIKQFVCLIWIGEADWGVWQPQPWDNDIILAAQVCQESSFGTQAWCGCAPCTSGRGDSLAIRVFVEKGLYILNIRCS